jgi:hypothetical protein
MEKEEFLMVEERVNESLKRAGLDAETRLLLKEAVEILEDLKASGFDYLSRQSFRLGVLLTKISEKMKEKGGDDGTVEKTG